MRLDKPTGEMVPDKSVRVETSGFSVDADFEGGGTEEVRVL